MVMSEAIMLSIEASVVMELISITVAARAHLYLIFGF